MQVIVRREHHERLKEVADGLGVGENLGADERGEGSARGSLAGSAGVSGGASRCVTHSRLMNRDGRRIMRSPGMEAARISRSSMCDWRSDARMNREEG